MLISPDEINKSLSTQGWQYKDQKISKTFNFNSYMEGIEFINKIAQIAEKEDHHPNITNVYNKVEIVLFTHSENAITEKDYNLANQIEEIFNS